MHNFERKESSFVGKYGHSVPLDLKMVNENGEFEGYASTFGNVDQGNDIMVSGCFADSLVKRPAERVKMLYQHDTDDIIGKWLEMREDNKGLYVKGKLFTNIQKGAEVYEIMKEGQLDGLSIGFRTIVDEWDRELSVRRVVKCDLKEVSIVTFPMNELATVNLVKGETLPTERELEKYLRDGGFSATQAKAIIAEGYKSLKGQRDAAGRDQQSVKDAFQELAQLMRG